MNEASATPARRRLLGGSHPAMLRLLVFFGGLALALVVIIVFDEIFFPLLLGLAIAYLFDPPVSWFERRLGPRVLGVVVLALVLLGAAAGFFSYLVPAMGEQAQRLAERFPAYRQRIEQQLLPWVAELQARYPEEFATVEARGRAALTENLPDVASTAGRVLGQIAGNALRLLLFVLNLIFVPVFAFYLLVDFPKIKAGARDLIPLPYRAMVLDRLSEVDRAVAGFLRGQLTIALILAAINATGLVLLGVPMGLVLGIVAGLANMIPYMALVVGLAPSLLLCWVEYQEPWRLGAVVAVFAFAQMLEGMVLSPRILGQRVNLHPVWVLLAVIAGGSLFGFIGMLVAVPVAAAIQVFVRHWLRIYRASPIYQADAEAPERSLILTPEEAGAQPAVRSSRPPEEGEG
jgi:predicted PurR-regulated permease PerM